MKATSALEKIIENTPLAFLVIGVILVVIGASQGLPYTPLQVKEDGWRLFLGVMGAITAGLGCLSFWRQIGLPTKQSQEGSDLKGKHETYGIKIISPPDGYPCGAGEKFRVEGKYDIKPPSGVRLAVHEVSPNSGSYYPKGKRFLSREQKPGRQTPYLSLYGNTAAAKECSWPRQ